MRSPHRPYPTHTGSFKPSQPLSALLGPGTSASVAGYGGSRGSWTLRVVDLGENKDSRGIEMGKWTLVLCPAAGANMTAGTVKAMDRKETDAVVIGSAAGGKVHTLRQHAWPRAALFGSLPRSYYYCWAAPSVSAAAARQRQASTKPCTNISASQISLVAPAQHDY